jgi:DNA adenine methylase
MAVILNKRPSQIDTANDKNGNVVNFFRVLRDRPDELISKLLLTPIAREEYNNCWVGSQPEYWKDIDDVERARRFFVRTRQSFCGLGSQRKNKGWHLVKTISRSHAPETVSKWHNAIDKLGPIIDRLQDIQIDNQDFRQLIPKLDFKGAFFYQDPPYTEESRASKNDYDFDFKNNDHYELAEINQTLEGKVMISGYDCKMYRDLYRHWNMVELPVKCNNLRSTPVKECIWMNY